MRLQQLDPTGIPQPC